MVVRAVVVLLLAGAIDAEDGVQLVADGRRLLAELEFVEEREERIGIVADCRQAGFDGISIECV